MTDANAQASDSDAQALFAHLVRLPQPLSIPSPRIPEIRLPPLPSYNGPILGDLKVPKLNLSIPAGMPTFSDLLHSDAVKAITDVKLPDVNLDKFTSLFELPRESIVKMVEAAGAVGEVAKACIGWAFDFVKFDLFRDFFQILSLFFTAFVFPEAFEKIFRFITNLFSIDFFSWLPGDISLYIFWALCVFSIILFFWFGSRKSEDPDAIRDGEEMVSWSNRQRSELWTTKIIVTLLITLYLPVSRNAVEMLVCAQKYAELFDPNFVADPTKSMAQYGTCEGTHFIIACVFSGLSLLLITLWLPIWVFNLIEKNKPRVAEFDAEGKAKPFVEVDYESALVNDQCPYQFLYRGYQRKWAFYKVIVMFLKLFLILAVVLVPKFSQSEVFQGVFVIGVLSLYTIISFMLSPFMRRQDDAIDQCSRVTTLFTSICAFVSFDSQALVLNIVHTANLVIMIVIVLLGLDVLAKRWKVFTNRVDFSNKGLIYDINRERKLRLWHPFWNVLFLCDNTLQPVSDRLQELTQIVGEYGAGRYEEALCPVEPVISCEREWVQNVLEGLDVFWDGTPQDGHLDSKTRFGKCYIVPFPWHVRVVYDDCDDYVFISDEEFLKFCMKNREPEVERRRYMRKILRSLNDKKVKYFYQEWREKRIGTGEHAKTERVLFTFNEGTLRVKHAKKNQWSHGFAVSIHYNDGSGRSSGGHYFTNEATTIGHGPLGINSEFYLSVGLNRLFTGNWLLVQQNLPQVYAQEQAYRQELINKRLDKMVTLSYSFWYAVYNHDLIPRGELNAYLYYNEYNPVVRDLPYTHAEALDFVYARMAWFNAHPVFGYWFVFWHDFYEKNYMLKMCEGKGELLSPVSGSSICYTPMDRESLENYLEQNGLTIKKEILDLLYERIGALMTSGEALQDLDQLSKAYLAPVSHLFAELGGLAGTPTQPEQDGDALHMRAAGGLAAVL